MNLYQKIFFVIVIQLMFGNTAIAQYQFDSKFGVSGLEDSNFVVPKGLSIDNNGAIYVCDIGAYKFVKFDKNKKFIYKHGDYQGNWFGDVLNFPSGICNDSLNNLFITDQANNRIQKYNSSGDYIESYFGIGPDSFLTPNDMAIGRFGTLFIADATDSKVKVYNYNCTKHIRNIGVSSNIQERLSYPRGIAIGKSGLIYVADYTNKIFVFDSLGGFKRWIGSYGDGIGQFSSPTGIAIDSNENIFVADFGNSRIQIFDSTGNSLGQIGSVGSSDGQLNSPMYLRIDKNGYVYVTEAGNKRVSIFKPAPKINIKHNLTRIAPTTGLYNFTNTVVNKIQTKSYTIENRGFDTLIVSNIDNASGSVNFGINTSLTNFQIPPFQSTTFEINFSPTSTGLIDAIIEVNSNDKTNLSYKFKVQGTGVKPIISLAFYSTTLNNTTSVDVGNIANGYSIPNDFKITNIGTDRKSVV